MPILTLGQNNPHHRTHSNFRTYLLHHYLSRSFRHLSRAMGQSMRGYLSSELLLLSLRLSIPESEWIGWGRPVLRSNWTQFQVGRCGSFRRGSQWHQSMFPKLLRTPTLLNLIPEKPHPRLPIHRCSYSSRPYHRHYAGYWIFLPQLE